VLFASHLAPGSPAVRKASTTRGALGVALLAAFAVSTYAGVAAADPRTEAIAKAAVRKAEDDFLGQNYGDGYARLDKALKACGAKKCTATTRAGLLRDLGAMAFRKGQKDQAARFFADALALKPELTLNPNYDAPDLRQAFAAAKRGGGGAGASGAAGGAGSAPAEGSRPANDTSDCPPDFPGCNKKNEAPPADSEDKGGSASEGSGAEAGSEGGKPKGAYRKVWVGIAGALDFQPMPSGHNLCRLVPQPEPTPPNAVVPNAGSPANSQNVYCTNLDGSDFPSRSSQDQNNALVPGSAGESGGGLHRGEARLMVSLDYALNPNFLLGARVGVSFFTYPGQAAYTEGHAYKFAGSRLYLDARGTYLFGDNAINKTIAPMIFLGLGMASFDTSTTSQITLNTGATGTVNLWQNNGPFFFLLGGGLHFMITDSLGGTLGIRLNGSFGSNGFVPTVGPELGLQYGF
jgi:hypothetical protein